MRSKPTLFESVTFFILRKWPLVRIYPEAQSWSWAQMNLKTWSYDTLSWKRICGASLILKCETHMILLTSTQFRNSCQYTPPCGRRCIDCLALSTEKFPETNCWIKSPWITWSNLWHTAWNSVLGFLTFYNLYVENVKTNSTESEHGFILGVSPGHYMLKNPHSFLHTEVQLQEVITISSITYK